jgi:hypothetical protein
VETEHGVDSLMEQSALINLITEQTMRMVDGSQDSSNGVNCVFKVESTEVELPQAKWVMLFSMR